MIGALHFIYYINRITVTKIDTTLFAPINQQYTGYIMSCGRAQTHDHRIGSQALPYRATQVDSFSFPGMRESE